MSNGNGGEDKESKALSSLDEFNLNSPDGKQSPELSIAQQVIPWPRDDDKCRYLAVRASGFTRREATKFLRIANSNVSFWRNNYPKFAEIEDNIDEYRHELSNTYIDRVFARNYVMVLEKDFRVIEKSLKKPQDIDEEDPWTKVDQEYLLKIRGQYNPQMLKVISDLMTGKSDQRDFNFTEVIMNLAANGEGRMAMEWKGNK